MKNRRNYYRILHVQPDAPAAIVRASYRTLMQKLKRHPDLGGDTWNAGCLNEAYAVISDPVRRARYDRENGFDYAQRVARDGDSTGTDSQSENVVSGTAAGFAYTQATAGPAAPACPFCGITQVNFRHQGTQPPCSHCFSPQQLPMQESGLNETERSLWRAPQEQAVSFYTHWPQAVPHRGRITDLSPKGIAIRSPLQLPKDSAIKIEAPKLRAVVRILNCHSEYLGGRPGYRAGGRFVTLEFASARGNFFSVKT